MTPLDPEFESAMDRFAEGDASEADARRLNAALAADPAARSAFLDYVHTHAMLACEGLASEAPIRAAGHAKRPTPARIIRFAAAAVVVLSFAGLMSMLISWARPHATGHAGAPVATLIDSHDAVWGQPVTGPMLPTDIGAQLPGGWVSLKSGTAKIEFFSGARVTLQGPAEFALNSSMRGYLRSGKLLAYCPAVAHGFTVGAPGCAVMDLGTEFGLVVDTAGGAKVVVLKGRVSLEARGRAGEALEAGAARSITSAGRVSVIPADRRAFAGLVSDGGAIEEIVLKADADATVAMHLPTTPLGGGKELIANNVPGRVRWSYVRFDLRNIKGRIVEARMKLMVNPGEVYRPLAVYGLVRRGAAEPWAESSITWESAPARVGNSLDLSQLFGGHELVQFMAPGRVEAVTPQTLFTEVEGSPTVNFLRDRRGGWATLILARPLSGGMSARGISWVSKEGGSPPELVLKIQKGD